MEQVILVNEKDEQVGIMEKLEAHQKGVLHRAFSVFIFNENGDMLLQQRSDKKYHSAGLWSNACCSHPLPGESTEDGAHRRLQEEMGFDTKLSHAFEFTYKTGFDNGLTEHEYDHVFIGHYDGELQLNAEEVKGYCFMPMPMITEKMESDPGSYTSWFKIAFPMLKLFLAAFKGSG